MMSPQRAVLTAMTRVPALLCRATAMMVVPGAFVGPVPAVKTHHVASVLSSNVVVADEEPHGLVDTLSNELKLVARLDLIQTNLASFELDCNTDKIDARTQVTTAGRGRANSLASPKVKVPGRPRANTTTDALVALAGGKGVSLSDLLAGHKQAGSVSPPAPELRSSTSASSIGSDAAPQTPGEASAVDQDAVKDGFFPTTVADSEVGLTSTAELDVSASASVGQASAAVESDEAKLFRIATTPGLHGVAQVEPSLWADYAEVDVFAAKLPGLVPCDAFDPEPPVEEEEPEASVPSPETPAVVVLAPVAPVVENGGLTRGGTNQPKRRAGMKKADFNSTTGALVALKKQLEQEEADRKAADRAKRSWDLTESHFQAFDARLVAETAASRKPARKPIRILDIEKTTRYYIAYFPDKDRWPFPYKHLGMDPYPHKEYLIASVSAACAIWDFGETGREAEILAQEEAEARAARKEARRQAKEERTSLYCGLKGNIGMTYRERPTVLPGAKVLLAGKAAAYEAKMRKLGLVDTSKAEAFQASIEELKQRGLCA